MEQTDVETNTEQMERSLDEAANVRYLAHGDFELTRGEAGTLRMTLAGEKSFLRVKTRRCFPFSYPSKYISLRDGADEEIGIIRDLADLSKDYRRWIEDDLDMRYFVPRVKSIDYIRYRYGGIEWQLLTDRGAKRVITKNLMDTMHEIQPGRYVISDVDGNRYEIFTEKLDAVSREKLEQLV